MVDKLVGMVRWSPICSNFYLDKILFGRKSVKYGVADESLKMPSTYKYFGGGASLIFSSDELLPYTSANLHEKQYKFVQCVKTEDKQSHITDDSKTVLCAVPLSILAPKMTMKCIKDLAILHKIYIPSKTSVKNAQILLQDHDCHECVSNISSFEPHKVQSNAQRQQKWYKNLELDEKTTYLAEKAKYKTSSKYQDKNRVKHKTDYWSKKEVMFPPAPLSADLGQQIVSDFCADTSPEVFEETGCAVCGKLTPVCEMEELSDVENLSLLKVDGITRKARSTSSDTVKELKGPILAPGCSNVCSICVESLEKGNMPILALANGLWVGEIPVELQNLTYAEQLLIARVRHNRCIVKVSSGMRKMCANAISFSNPMPKIYNVLPPPIEEMDEVLAFIYTGPCKPTKADFKRTPLLVRRLKVSRALHWLKLNHIDYYDCEISESNLASYPEDGPPVVVDYHLSSSNKNPESTSVHDMEEGDGTAEGPCPFIVHGLTGEEFSTKTMKTIKVIALQHLTSERKILAIGHSETPESIYGNPQLFPSMLPWLFPYGLGGIGQTEHKYKLSSMMHKRHLLMYYDKRFQKDPHFLLIAFNHEQMKESTTAGYLTAERKTFNNITDRLMNVNLEVLSDLTKRMTEGERVKPETDEEKLCFKPWRHGKDLKGHGQSWDEAFTNYKFTPCQTELMKFFNIRYECNDARDDYSKLLKQKNATGGIFPHWFRSNDNNNFGDDDDYDGADCTVHKEQDADEYTAIGKKGLQRIEQMAEIQKIVTAAGWLDQCTGGSPSLDFKEIHPQELPPSQWDAAVQEKRQQVLAERNKALPTQSGKQAGTDPNQNDVQIVDRSYLRKNFNAQSEVAQNLIEDVIKKFELTTEQERAFRIVANHAVTPGVEQLIMYVGGMEVLENHKSSKLSWTFLNLEMNPTDSLFWLQQELQQHFCMGQLITHF